MASVCILDYGSGNVKSVFNLLAAVTDQVVISNNPAEVEAASHLVLPGVGAFGPAMRRIREALPVDLLTHLVLREQRPFLGICVGMQVLADRGTEFGDFAGLGWIAGVVEKLPSSDLPLPHIGWNNVEYRAGSPLFEGLGKDPDFYFVHSYALHPAAAEHVMATTQYGVDFCSVLQCDNIVGVQFHPEKSQSSGLQLMKNFLAFR